MIHWRREYAVLAVFALLTVAMFALPVQAQTTDTNQPAATTETAQPTASDQPAADQGQTSDDTEKPQPKTRRWTLVPAINNYMPSSGKTQSRFGSNWLSFGLALSMKNKEADAGRLEIHLDGAARRGDGLQAYIFPVGIGYAQRVAQSKVASAYLGACANLYAVKLRSDYDNVDPGWCGRVGASAFVGMNLGQKINLQVSYYAMPTISGFDLSGTNLSLHIKF